MENLDNEVWVTIENFPNYKISNMGRVLATDYINKGGKKEKPRILRACKNSDGYLHVCLSNMEGSKTISVHRLVADGFIKKDLIKSTVNHINGNKTDNMLINLERATIREQLLHAYATGLKKYSPNAKIALIKKIGKKVECFNKITQEKTFHNSARECSRFVGKSDRWCDKIIGSQDGETYNYKLRYSNN